MIGTLGYSSQIRELLRAYKLKVYISFSMIREAQANTELSRNHLRWDQVIDRTWERGIVARLRALRPRSQPEGRQLHLSHIQSFWVESITWVRRCTPVLRVTASLKRL